LLQLLEDANIAENNDNNTVSNTATLQEQRTLGKNTIMMDYDNKNQHHHYSRVYYDGMHFNQLLRSTHDGTIWIVEGNDFSGGSARYETMLSQELQQQQQQQQLSNQTTTHSSSLSLSPLKPRDVHFLNFYHHLFHASFQPSPAIAKRLQGYIDVGDDSDDTFWSINNNDDDDDALSLPIKLQPNRYMVAHYRAKFPGEPYRETWNVTILEKTALHAANCARSRGAGLSSPSLSAIYVASDTALAIDAINKHYNNNSSSSSGNNVDINVWTYLNLRPKIPREQHTAVTTTTTTTAFAVDPPHLNFAKLDDASGFYGIFVDLFLMSYSYCVVYGAGGFGRFGNLVSFHPRCGVPFTRQNGRLQQCPRYSHDDDGNQEYAGNRNR
jgi:hypothetical protein